MLVGNHLVNPQNANDSRAAIGISATDPGYPAPQVGTVVVEGNYIYNWYKAIVAGAGTVGKKIGSLTVANNVVERGGVATCQGWDLDDLGWLAIQQCAMRGNELINVAPTWVTYPPCPILVGGERGGGGTYLCNGSPNGAIADGVGAIARRRDGGAGTTLWVKEFGTGNTGWVSK